MKKFIKNTPILGGLVARIHQYCITGGPKNTRFPGSKQYWERRYSVGGNSGAGSYDKFAEFKADIINEFIKRENIQSVIEFGCGDGNQLSLAQYPKYIGIDVSLTVIQSCREKFKSDHDKTFILADDYHNEKSDLALSLDVIFHLVEDPVYEVYMDSLFSSALKYVIIYSSNSEDNAGYEETHVKHRMFTDWVLHNASEWRLSRKIPNRYPYAGDHKTGSFSDFYFYEKI